MKLALEARGSQEAGFTPLLKENSALLSADSVLSIYSTRS